MEAYELLMFGTEAYSSCSKEMKREVIKNYGLKEEHMEDIKRNGERA